MTTAIKQIIIVTLITSYLPLTGCGNVHYSYPAPEINLDNLKSTVSYLAEINPSRNYQNPNSLEKAANYISGRFAEYGIEPIRQEFTVRGQIYSNVLASVGTSENNNEVFVVGAHYDVCGDQPGADDNASGIAGLLEIARFAKRYEDQLPCRIEFVAYCLEEPPFFATEQMGSYIHAKSLFDKNADVRGMISLEMIGFFSDTKNSQQFPLGIMKLFFPNQGDFIAVISNYRSSTLTKNTARHMKVAEIKVRSLKAPSFVQGVDFSDHRNYWKFGYDAVMVSDTAFFRNSNYHKKTDTIETLSFDKMKEVVSGVCWAILNL